MEAVGIRKEGELCIFCSLLKEGYADFLGEHGRASLLLPFDLRSLQIFSFFHSIHYVKKWLFFAPRVVKGAFLPYVETTLSLYQGLSSLFVQKC